jgi:hypothetical protein
VADLLGGGEADNVAIAGQWTNEARMGFAPVTKGTGGVRPMPGVLGLSLTFPFSLVSLRHLALVDRDGNPISPDQFHSSPAQDRLSNQVWGDGD